MLNRGIRLSSYKTECKYFCVRVIALQMYSYTLNLKGCFILCALGIMLFILLTKITTVFLGNKTEDFSIPKQSPKPRSIL